MNKLLVILTILLVYPFFATSQVSINSRYSIGKLLIDGDGDNTSTIPTSVQLENDVIFNVSTLNEAILGIGGTPYNSAQLSLNATNKALGLNIVNLTSGLDLTTVPSPSNGLTVYNKDSSIDDGVYFFLDNEWAKMTTNIYAGSFMNLLNLQAPDVVTRPITQTQLSAELYSAGTELNFISTDNGTIKILEDGAYSFNMHLSGTVSSGSSEYAYYYVFLVNATLHSVLDSYTIALKPNNNAPQTASVFLNANFTKDDEVKIYICHEDTNNRTWTLKSSSPGSTDLIRSYMVFWKL
ncbi:hypothetical protein [Dysgonomonas macrotermitis]|uniref:C1q domain-containing protein n=1 Tax=Dysgonomonas macrotermitis TaxID=1346286 RepID=A0A1M5JUS2_9BACT|nr:hypothetical protein [Dysgonomonas macrotermitis]SHG44155.1 hypothetical protein SAMN05444362_1292 [Dysgonomonas macrotermitis]